MALDHKDFFKRWALGLIREPELAEAVIEERAALALDREASRTALDRESPLAAADGT